VGIGTNNPSVSLDVYTGNVSSLGYQVIGNYNSTGAVPQNGIYSSSAIHPDGYGATIISSRIGASRPIIFATYSGSLGERVRIAGNGLVGIGTNNPQSNLHINGSQLRVQSYGASYAEYYANNGTNALDMGVELAGGSLISGSGANEAVLSGSGLYKMHFGTSSTIRMTINNAGLVGIGTTTPQYKLTVQTSEADGGISVFDNTSSYEVGRLFRDSTTSNGRLILKSADVIKVNLNANSTSYFNGGRVGIGTSSPISFVNVWYTDSSTTGFRIDNLSENPVGNRHTADFRYSGASGRTQNNTELVQIYDNCNGSTQPLLGVTYDGTGTPPVAVFMGGNVGIGGTPTTNLEILGTNPMQIIRDNGGNHDYAATLRLLESTDFLGAYIQYDSSGNQMVIGTHNTADTTVANDIEAMTIARTTGNVSFLQAVNLATDKTLSVDYLAEQTGTHGVVCNSKLTADSGVKSAGAEYLKTWTYTHTVTAGEAAAHSATFSITALTLSKVRSVVAGWRSAGSSIVTFNTDSGGSNSFIRSGITNATTIVMTLGTNIIENDILLVTIIEAV
jgi:hypothetical protein